MHCTSLSSHQIYIHKQQKRYLSLTSALSLRTSHIARLFSIPYFVYTRWKKSEFGNAPPWWAAQICEYKYNRPPFNVQLTSPSFISHLSSPSNFYCDDGKFIPTVAAHSHSHLCVVTIRGSPIEFLRIVISRIFDLDCSIVMDLDGSSIRSIRSIISSSTVIELNVLLHNRTSPVFPTLLSIRDIWSIYMSFIWIFHFYFCYLESSAPNLIVRPAFLLITCCWFIFAIRIIITLFAKQTYL